MVSRRVYTTTLLLECQHKGQTADLCFGGAALADTLRNANKVSISDSRLLLPDFYWIPVHTRAFPRRMSFVRRCETPSTRELGTFDDLLRKSAGLAQIIVDNARVGELGKYVVTNTLQIMSTWVWPRGGGEGAIFASFFLQSNRIRGN